ncbi:MAG: NAD(P)/FAD-dependent oxidoreductase [Saprospiraceae bacterium]
MKTDVCIIGAGPAGSTASLYLSKNKINHVIIDKATFPRDIVCGEGFRGTNVFWALEHLNPNYIKELQATTVDKMHWMKFCNNENKEFFINLGDTSSFGGRRIDFDNFLVNKVKESNYANFMEGQTPKDIQYKPSEGYELMVNGQKIEAKILICATGATSYLPQKLGMPSKDKLEKVIGMRAHYKGLKEEGNGVGAVYFLDTLKGGYLWIIPLYDGYFNVGMAIKEKVLKKNNWNVKQLFQDCLEHPNIKNRFTNATLEEKAKGKFLHLPNYKVSLSSSHLMVAGSAGMAIDPATGNGVSHAMATGRYAANHAVECLQKNVFSAKAMKEYDKSILKKLRGERLVAKLYTYLVSKPRLVNFLIPLLSNNKTISKFFKRKDVATKIYTTFTRKQL